MICVKMNESEVCLVRIDMKMGKVTENVIAAILSRNLTTNGGQEDLQKIVENTWF